MWDLLNQLYKRFGLWALLFVALAFATVWFVAHINAQPCEQVSVFGLIKYTKECGNSPGSGSGNDKKCGEFRQHLGENGREQAALRHEIARLESAASKGDTHARNALEESLTRLNALKRDGQEIEAQIQSQCPH